MFEVVKVGRSSSEDKLGYYFKILNCMLLKNSICGNTRMNTYILTCQVFIASLFLREQYLMQHKCPPTNYSAQNQKCTFIKKKTKALTWKDEQAILSDTKYRHTNMYIWGIKEKHQEESISISRDYLQGYVWGWQADVLSLFYTFLFCLIWLLQHMLLL